MLVVRKELFRAETGPEFDLDSQVPAGIVVRISQDPVDSAFL
jgi:hypothetical protein